MKVLTFGWDFPPSRNGGLGVACLGLTRELLQDGVEVIFVLPKRQEVVGDSRFIFADSEFKVRMKETYPNSDIQIREVTSNLKPYQSAESLVHFIEGYDEYGNPIISSRTVADEIHRFAHQASLIAQVEDFDIIHAHDWSSFLAGVAAKTASGKPLILHVHATSFDQAGGDNVDPKVFGIEKEGFAQADKIVTVSAFTRDILINKHGVNPDKIEVIHNGCDTFDPVKHEPTLNGLKEAGKKIVLYHGRITIQKGVDHFINAARKVIDTDPNVVFVISGWGDMLRQITEQVGRLGLSKHVIFAGALWEEERDRMYQSADLVVMPSVSEPFGLVPLEALQHGTASLVTHQSGVAEVLTHVLKVDFWDVDEMANKILSALRYPVMRKQMVNEGRQFLPNIGWNKASKKVTRLYKNLLEYIN